MDELFIFFTFISIATERLVEFTKGIVPFLNAKSSNKVTEERRKIAIMALASVLGIVIVLIVGSQPQSSEILPEGWDSPLALVIIALLASGGSSGWNRLIKIKEQANGRTTAKIGIT